MSEALTRVIAEQQKKIDWLEEQSKSATKQIQSEYKRYMEAMKLLDGVVDLRIKCADEANHKTLMDYRQKIRLWMMERGWCFNCGDFNCECRYDE